MSNQQNLSNKKSLKNLLMPNWHFFLALCALEGIPAILRLLSITADAKNQVFMGLSISRLTMIAFITCISILLIILALKSIYDYKWKLKYLNPVSRKKIFTWIIILALAASFLSWIILFVTKYYPEKQLIAYYERLLPILSWIILVGIQTSIWLSLLYFDLHIDRVRIKKPFLMVFLITGIVILSLYVYIHLTGIGITPDAVAWGEPGVPLLEWQIWLGLFLGLLSIIGTALYQRFHISSFQKKWWESSVALDITVALLIWLLTVCFWLSEPVPRSYFSLIPRPPNFEIYPYSDAANHDLVAQQILIGNGFDNGKVVKRPLLCLFFAALHAFVGQNYSDVITLQTFILAIFPVVLYFIGKHLHSRILGIVMAFWAIFRELNAIAATPYARVSHSKLLLSDLPAALGIAIIIYLTILWCKYPRHRIFPLLCGGTLGLLMLVRTQSLFLLVFILPVTLIRYQWKWRSWFSNILILSTGILLSISPWIIRNYHFTGRFVFDQTEQTGIIAQRYTDLPGYAMPPRLPGESEEEYTQRFLRNTIQYTLSNPDSVLTFITAHFLNNEISSALIIPVRTEYNDFKDVFTITSTFWGKPIKDMSSSQFLLLGTNLAVICVGIASSYQRRQLSGLLPLMANLTYSMSNAIVRNSGGRYILPVDWAGYFYYAYGMLEIIICLLLLFGLNSSVLAHITNKKTSDSYLHNGSSKKKSPARLVFFTGVIFLLIGSSLPLVEIIVPKIYPPQSPQIIAESLMDNQSLAGNKIDMEQMRDFLTKKSTVIIAGRALYPVFLVPGEGEPGYGWAYLEKQDFPRLSFYVIGSQNSAVVLPLEKPVDFPNTADVIVVGCSSPEEYLDAILISINDNGNHQIYIRSGDDIFNCPER